jgi:CHAT domain-containing protein/tetratricopeptide (TPR) repeat protein
MIDAAQRDGRIEQAVRTHHAGDVAQACKAFEACLPLFGEQEQSGREYADFCQAYGGALTDSGKVESAKWYLGRALAIYDVHGATASAAWTHLSLGNLYSAIGSNNRAFEHFSRAVRLFRTAGDQHGLARGLLSLASLFLALGQLEEALRFLTDYEQVDPTVQRAADLRWSYLMAKAHAAHRGGDLPASLGLLHDAREIAVASGVSAYVAATDARIGALLLEQGTGAAAIEHLQRAAEEVAAGGAGPVVHIDIAFERAKAALNAKDLPTAKRLYDEALDAVDALRLQVGVFERYHVTDRLSRIAREYVCALFEHGEYTAAFEASERGQGRVILDRMFDHQVRRQGGRTIVAGPNSRLLLKSPTFAEVAQHATEHDLHIAKFFYVERSRLLGWLVGPGGWVDCWDASRAGARLGDVLDLLLDLNANTGDDGRAEKARARWHELRPMLGRLYAKLFSERARERLDGPGGRLAVVPHMQLHHVPFGLLVTSHDRHLSETWQLSVAPSAAVLLQLDRRRDPDGACLPRLAVEGRPALLTGLVVGDCGAQSISVPLVRGEESQADTIEFAALTGAREEAKNVAARVRGAVLLLGEEATREAILRALPFVRIVHLATHGWWHGLGEKSFVVTAGTKGNNALFGEDIAESTLQAELVVLSACQTELGALHPDSYIGLPQSFLIGGARAVLASLYPVNDLATAALIDRFYEELETHSPAEALQRGQARLRDEVREYADSYFWGGFQFVGRPFERIDAVSQTRFAGPQLRGAGMLWADGPPGAPLSLPPLAQLRQRWDEKHVFAAGIVLPFANV